MRIGITCYPTVGGSGILASALGLELASRGHEVHFISYERPVRVAVGVKGVHFHGVEIQDYALFRYPDYTLPLSVKMAEVSRDANLDILHVHYAVPHATAALLARDMLPPAKRPKIVTTLHGTDTTLLARERAYAPAIRHALEASDAVTAVSAWLKDETQRLLALERPIHVIHNFYRPAAIPPDARAEIRAELGITHQPLAIHVSNLRRVKRIDLLLAAAALMAHDLDFKLLILAGGSFSEYASEVDRLHLADRIIVREEEVAVEPYLAAADLGLYTSDSESFCLAILEGMCFSVPSVATRVGGVPEVVGDDAGLLVDPGDAPALARAATALLRDPARRQLMADAGRRRAAQLFSPDRIVAQYESLYRNLLATPAPGNPA